MVARTHKFYIFCFLKKVWCLSKIVYLTFFNVSRSFNQQSTWLGRWKEEFKCNPHIHDCTSWLCIHVIKYSCMLQLHVYMTKLFLGIIIYNIIIIIIYTTYWLLLQYTVILYHLCHNYADCSTQRMPKWLYWPLASSLKKSWPVSLTRWGHPLGQHCEG